MTTPKRKVESTWSVSIAAVRQVVAVSSVIFGVVACGGTWNPTPADPNSCPDLRLDLVRQPAAALALEWTGSDPEDRTGHHWGAVDRLGAERYLNVEYVPQGGWSVPANTQGIAFDMWAHSPDNFGFDSMEGIGVVYLLEYSVPRAPCDMAVVWDTHLTITLPHGVCVAREGNPGSCSSNDVVYADFQMLSINDPTGAMSVSGQGRAALESAVEASLNAVDERSRIHVSTRTSSRLRKSRAFQGNFNVAQGANAKVFVGVAAMVQKAPHGWVCLNDCTTSPSDRLVDSGLFMVEGGDDGVIGIAMSGTP